MSIGTARRARGRAACILLACALSPLGLAATAAMASDPPAPSASSRPAATAAPKSTTVFLHPPPAPSSVTLGRTLPDPTALVSKEQWVYDLRYSTGDLYLLGIHHIELPAPQATPRAMGRFSLELWEGATLLERARFDFPMLGDGADLDHAAAMPEAGAPLPIQGRAPSIYAKVSSRIGVMFPAWPKGTRLEIVDRATGRKWPLPWPPTEMSGAPPPNSEPQDAGAVKSNDGG